MKNTYKLFLAGVMTATLGLNLSLDSSGKFSLISKVSAAPQTDTQPVNRYEEVEASCFDDQGNMNGTYTSCAAGSNSSCAVITCPPSTTE